MQIEGLRPRHTRLVSVTGCGKTVGNFQFIACTNSWRSGDREIKGAHFIAAPFDGVLRDGKFIGACASGLMRQETVRSLERRRQLWDSNTSSR